MTTINGVEFNMVNLRPVAVHRNETSNQPGSDTNFITDMGYDGLVLRLEGYEKTLATYDSVISEFMKTGEQTLVHRTGWQFSIYSAQLSLDLIEGFADNYFPYDLILLTSTPYRESTTLSCRAKAITANNQEWSAEDMPCDNLLDNWSFEDWSAGAAAAPDGWTESSSTAIQESTIVKIGTNSVKVSIGAPGASGRITQTLTAAEYNELKGKQVTAGVWVYSAGIGISRILLNDGVSSFAQGINITSGAWVWITATGTADAAASTFTINLYPDISNSTTNFAYFDGAVLVEGDSIPDNTFIRDIDTDGSVDAVPDIEVTGTINTTDLDEVTGEIINYSFEDIIAGEWIYSEVDTSGVLSGARNNPSVSAPSTWMYEFYAASGTAPANGDYAKVTQNNIDLTDADYLTLWVKSGYTGAYWEAYHRVYIDSDLVLNDAQDPLGYGHWKTINVSKYTGTHSIGLMMYFGSGAHTTGYRQQWDHVRLWKIKKTIDVQIYNIADSTVKCNIANNILGTATHRINVDGTGTISFDDDFTTDKSFMTSEDFLNVTQDTTNDELDIADDGYIYWKCDAKYPITGIPTLTSQVNITTGTPTIQIAADSGGSPDTWYDITTAIVDDVDTTYDLDSASLHLKGSTLFYFRFDCVKAAAATCSIKSFELDIDIVTIDAEHPVITTGGSASTIRCDQDSDSGMNCTVALYYRDRSWPA